jgi:hypothetical protein
MRFAVMRRSDSPALRIRACERSRRVDPGDGERFNGLVATAHRWSRRWRVAGADVRSSLSCLFRSSRPTRGPRKLEERSRLFPPSQPRCTWGHGLLALTHRRLPAAGPLAVDQASGRSNRGCDWLAGSDMPVLSQRFNGQRFDERRMAVMAATAPGRTAEATSYWVPRRLADRLSKFEPRNTASR